jgi:hypothetical protein
MKPKQAILPFLKLLLNDRRNFLKAVLRYTTEADKRKYYQKKYQDQPVKFVDIGEIADVDVQLENYTYLDGTSRPIDIAFLMAVCGKYKDCNYLEIGSWRGESLFNVAKIAKSCTSLSLAKEDMLAMGMNKKAADLQQFFSKDLPNVRHIEANSLTYDFSKIEDKFDVIFVDGDHTYDGVKSDTQNAFKLLRDEHSVIVFHDCGGGYEGFRYEVITAILDGLPPNERSKFYRVTNSICGIYTNQDIAPLNLNSPQTPNKTFSIDLKLIPIES